MAMNYTGISEQVPCNCSFISNGPSKEYEYQGMKISFTHVNEKYLQLGCDKLVIAVQAIKCIGNGNILDRDIDRLAIYCKDVKDLLLKNTTHLPV